MFPRTFSSIGARHIGPMEGSNGSSWELSTGAFSPSIRRRGRPLTVSVRAGSSTFVPASRTSFPNRLYGMSSSPAIYRDLVICGSLTPDAEPRGPSGDVRAFEARSGKLVWTFHTVAQSGEFGNETWRGGSSTDRGGVNAWPPLSVDPDRGIVYLPLTSPSVDFYGGDRPGNGLFGDSLVALDAATGKRIWHYQTVHHNLWDYDLPAQPVLVTVRRDARSIAGVAQVTKTGFTFVFDRETGRPLFDIVERPVPPSEVPGEQAARTQPFPVKPPPYARQSMTADELTGVTPESRQFCADLVKDAVFGSLYTPIGLKRTVLFPGTNGGANWGGASVRPQLTHLVCQLDGCRDGVSDDGTAGGGRHPVPPPGRPYSQFPILG